jgi:hypothetical protein
VSPFQCAVPRSTDCKLCAADAEHDSRFDLDKSAGFFAKLFKARSESGRRRFSRQLLPFRTCSRRINHRGNGKVCFMKTRTSFIRNSTSRPSRFNTMKLRRQTALRAALIRLWLTAGVTACLAAPAAKAAPAISATPNPVVYVTKPKGPLVLLNQGITTVTWDAGADHPYADVWVSVDGGAETLFSTAHKGPRPRPSNLERPIRLNCTAAPKFILGLRLV